MPAKIHGRLGAQSLNTTTPTLVYVCPAARKATVTVNLANTAAASTNTIALYLTNTGTPSGDDTIEAATVLDIGGVLERPGITMAAGNAIYASSVTTAQTMVAVVWGIEEDA